MRLDAYNDDFAGRARNEVLRNGRYPHAEGGFVRMFDGVGDREFGTRLAEAGAVLCRRVDGNVKDGAGFDHLLRGGDSVVGSGLMIIIVSSDGGRGV